MGSNQEEESESSSDPPTDVQQECNQWQRKFQQILNQTASFDKAHFDEVVTNFLRFLFEANEHLPGPMHPAVKMYRKRKSGQKAVHSGQYKKSSNAKRRDARIRQRRRDRYDYELAQYQYYNHRRKVARKVLHPQDKSSRCTIPLADLESHFKQVFESVNDRVLEHYQKRTRKDDISITLDQVKQAIKAVKLDTAPGPDRVLIRTVRDLNIAQSIKIMAEIMLATGHVPKSLTEGRTVVIPKTGDSNDLNNWRPITIYSVVRRIIERVLDKHIRDQVNINRNQRGFITGVQGCHVNSNLVNACLRHAKQNKSDCTVVFLDVSKAYDRVGHEHIKRSLEAQGVSKNLQALVMNLLQDNTVRIDTATGRSNQIHIKRGVPQGGPLSPILFDIAINYIYEEICDPQFANQYGYKLFEDLDALSLTGFADDQAVTTRTLSGALRIVEMTQSLFQQIGLSANPNKSSAISIKDGQLVPGALVLNDGATIECINADDRIRYLGCSFNSEMVFDMEIVSKFTEYINNLITSPLLKKDQKLNLLNQYILPMLTYPLQAAPLRKIPMKALDTLDLEIRGCIRSVIGLPKQTTIQMMYAPRKYRGLGVVCCRWEVYLQHFAIAQRLATLRDELFHRVYDCQEEMAVCKRMLQADGETVRSLRAVLRDQAFEQWSSNCRWQGYGVSHFKTFPQANRFVYNKNTLSCSEWTAAIKLSVNYANLAGVPGVAEGHESNHHCRRCDGETETPAHVLGSCSFGENRRIARHNRLKHQLTEMLQTKGFECFEEVYCTDSHGSNRFVDILVFDPGSDQAFIVDPTIRYESNEDVGSVVQKEKHDIYKHCFKDLATKYPQFGHRHFEVIGLWMGARGAISQQMVDFFDRLGLDKKKLPIMAESVLSDSIHMLHHHIYA